MTLTIKKKSKNLIESILTVITKNVPDVTHILIQKGIHINSLELMRNSIQYFENPPIYRLAPSLVFKTWVQSLGQEDQLEKG